MSEARQLALQNIARKRRELIEIEINKCLLQLKALYLSERTDRTDRTADIIAIQKQFNIWSVMWDSL
jgi:hypothetical protein